MFRPERIPAAMAVALLLLANAAAAQLKLGREESIPEPGVRLRIFKDMTAMPMRPPRGGVRPVDQANVVLVADYWKFIQCVGEWRGAPGSITAGEIKFSPPPSKFQVATTAEFEEKVPAAAPDKWSDAELIAWTELFCGNGAKFTAIEIPFAGNDTRVRRFTPAGNSPLEVYLVTSGGIRKRHLVIVYRLASTNTNLRASEQKLCRRSAAGVAFSASARPTRERPDESGGGRNDAQRSGFTRALASIRGLKGWWHQETTNYVFISNQRSRRDLNRIQNGLEKARRVYLQYYNSGSAAAMIGIVRFFETRQEYLKYVGPELEWSGGCWSPAHLELLVSPLPDGAPDSVQEKTLRRTAYHEGFHQYLHYAANTAVQGMWFNEGNAEFFEHLEVHGNSWEVKLSDAEIAEIRRLLRRPPELRQLISLGRDGFYQPDRRERNYHLALGLIYYLLKGAPAENRPAYAAIPFVYFRTLAATRSDKEARSAAFSEVDFAKLDADFTAFWSDRNRLRAAERFNRVFRP